MDWEIFFGNVYFVAISYFRYQTHILKNKGKKVTESKSNRIENNENFLYDFIARGAVSTPLSSFYYKSPKALP